jgi:repressor LexA
MTEIQRQTLVFIDEQTKGNGYAPSLRELGEHFEISIGAVQGRIEGLKLGGYLTWKAGASRTLRVLAKV